MNGLNNLCNINNFTGQGIEQLAPIVIRKKVKVHGRRRRGFDGEFIHSEIIVNENEW